MRRKNVSLNDPSFVFTTYDLGCSTALLCAGFELLDIEKSNPKKALFKFKRESKIDEVANSYFADKLNVRARSFADNLKALKISYTAIKSMMLSDENIIDFQKLYKEHFGKDLNKKEAYEQGMKLLQLVSIVYRPMTAEDFEKLQTQRVEILQKQK
jgi:hypothetical protein